MKHYFSFFNLSLFCCIVLLGSCKSDSKGQEKAANFSLASQKIDSPQFRNNPKYSTDPVMNGPADIKVTISDKPNEVAYLIGVYSDRNFRVDSALVDSKGTFEFKREEGYPEGVYYVVFKDNFNLQLILGDDQTFEMTTLQSDVFNAAEISGSDDMRLLYESSAFENELSPQFTAINQRMQGLDKASAEYKAIQDEQEALVQKRTAYFDKLFADYPNSFFTIFKKAGQNPALRKVPESAQMYYFRRDFWKDVDFSDVRLMRTPVVANKTTKYFKDYTPQNADSLWSSAKYLLDLASPYDDYFTYFANWIPLNYEPTKTTLMDPEKLFVYTVQNYFTKDKATWADSMQLYGIQRRAQEMAGSLTGHKGPDVISTNPQGESKSIYEMDADYIIVYMYNPDCEHCMIETPKLRDFYNENKGNGIDVFAIAIDTDDQKWKDYINKNNLNWTNVYDPTNRSIYGKYYVDITPEIYVLNKERKIIGKNLKTNQIMTIIDRDKNK